MSAQSFVHLHVHTMYSLLDGAIRVGPLVSQVAELGMPAVAMTDHGNMFGAVEFFKKCKKSGVKPIIGIELDLTTGSLDDPRSGTVNHLTLLARNDAGYRNLMRLTSRAHLDGYVRGQAFADHAMLEEFREGLIAMSGDLGGEIPRAILRGDMDTAERMAGFYRDLFGPDHFYLEVMDNKFPEQTRVNEALVELGERLSIPLVATNDCHYLTQQEAAAHAVLMCIQLQKTIDLKQATSHGIDSFYLKSADEMWAAFADLPQACENTLKIADMVDFEMTLGQVFLPQYQVPDTFYEIRTDVQPRTKDAIHAYFRHVAREGLEARIRQLREQGRTIDEAEYHARLDIEMGVICDMDFPGYFLIVWDFIRWSKEQGISVGPGRGSGAGSLVAYSMLITDINPMDYGLLFERFLNPERVSMPDFDIDFCMNRRGEVIEYVTRKYGEMNVGQIVTYGALKAKACIRDVARCLNFSYADGDRIAKLVPDELGITLQGALDMEPKLRQLVDDDPRVKELFTVAMQLEGLYRQTGMHAAGIVISEEPLWEYVPICRGAGDELVTQYAKNEVEEAGLVKFDFLGLKTLTVIDEAVALVNDTRAERGEEAFDLAAIAMDDRPVFKLLSEARTTGVFQLESSGFKELLAKLKPDCFEDIVAAVALYRPGPLGSGMVDDFVRRKHGEIAVEYPHPWTEDILRETYGVIVYQEQVMQIAQKLAGFSLGGADIMRRAMGKKKAEEMAKQRVIFCEGAEKLGVDPQRAGEIFDLIEYFAGYGFNKSHSAAYALISYQTAWLKTHYPVEFTAALLTCDRENTAKVVRTIFDARDSGIEVLPPDVNESKDDFSVASGKIRFGLGAVKGVGTGAIEAIIEARTGPDGRFEGLFDFCERVDLRRVNKRVLEALVRCGAFDSTWNAPLETMHDIGEARARMLEAISLAIDRGQRTQADREAGQTSLFDMFAAKGPDIAPDAPENYPSAELWSDKKVLHLEKQTLGFYVTGHPLDRYADELKLYADCDTTTITKKEHREEVAIAGVVASMRERVTKAGNRVAFFMLEDMVGQIEVLCFTKCYAEYEEIIKADEPILVRGQVSIEGDDAAQQHKLRASEVQLLTQARADRVGHVMVEFPVQRASEQVFSMLREVFGRHPGDCRTYLRLQYPDLGHATLLLPDDFKVSPTDEFMNAVEGLFGGKHVVKLR